MAERGRKNLLPEETKIVRSRAFVLGCTVVLAALAVAGVVFLVRLPNRSQIANTSSGTQPLPSSTPIETGSHLPEFPWPPRSSAYTKIPAQYVVKLEGQTLLRDVAARLESALKSAGYSQTGYYYVPGGFALVSQLEQFKPNGLPADDPYRWSMQIQTPSFFSLEYLTALIKGKIGRYRVIVFAVSDDFFSQASGKRVESEEAYRLAIEGANTLPDTVGSQPFTDRHTCTALVYEFEKAILDKPAQFKENSAILAETHLQKILPYLKR